MAVTLLVHIANQEPVKIDCDDIPSPTDLVIIGRNPRDRADKEVNWVDEGVTTVILPWWRINFVQVIPGADQELEFPLPFRGD